MVYSRTSVHSPEVIGLKGRREGPWQRKVCVRVCVHACELARAKV